ncbi:MAG: adenylate/guanylate cyclase domain-containing protein [Anaerolineae bacterium]|nr:adenylate/guanylate cyclase domain-containing protein [Anaerolineae bacterium]
MTALFVNVCPFETLLHYIRPDNFMAFLNQHLTIATDAVHRQGGIIDKYMGEIAMGLFNTQLNPSANHAARAVRAALSIARGVSALQQKLNIDPEKPYYRIGIHSGVATVGNVGSPSRREFTAIGDTINLARRLEQNATFGQIILSEDTYRLCQGFLDAHADTISVIERGARKVKGRQQPAQIYEVCYR